MIFFGKKSSKIGEVNVIDSICPSCAQQGTQSLFIFGNYVHVYWIPFFPLGKDAIAECTHCKRTLRQKEFTSSLTHAYQNEKKMTQRPYWHWSGLALLVLLIVLLETI